MKDTFAIAYLSHLSDSYLDLHHALKFSLTILLGVLWLVSAQGQSLSDPSIKGVMFYKQHAFETDSTSVWPIEYRVITPSSQVMVVLTRQSKRLRVRPEQISLTIPYPGRGEITREEAIGLCDVALDRFPQHRSLIQNIHNAWEKLPPSPRVQQAQAPAPEKPNTLASLWAGFTVKAEEVRVAIRNSISTTFESVTKQFAAKPTPTPAPAPFPRDEDGEKIIGTLDLEKNLKIIQDFQEKSRALEEELAQE